MGISLTIQHAAAYSDCIKALHTMATGLPNYQATEPPPQILLKLFPY